MSTITKEFTKEQLIARTEMRLAMVAGFPESKLASNSLMAPAKESEHGHLDQCRY
ncbi:hypothetical protein NOX44_004046 [Enterobacter hormaechei]|nr:hypothetical protein [Enterobacter hormaechei]